MGVEQVVNHLSVINNTSSQSFSHKVNHKSVKTIVSDSSKKQMIIYFLQFQTHVRMIMNEYESRSSVLSRTVWNKILKMLTTSTWYNRPFVKYFVVYIKWRRRDADKIWQQYNGKC